MRVLSLLISVFLLTAVTACEPIRNFPDSQYWQKADTSEAIYMRGPKAQQMLQRDIGRCTSELRELDRMDVIKAGFPADKTQRRMNNTPYPDPDSQTRSLDTWETPDRDGYLLVENSDYYDFEGCMLAKGWERTEYVSYRTMQRSEEDYVEAVKDMQYRSKHGGRPKPPPEEMKRAPSRPDAADQSNYNN